MSSKTSSLGTNPQQQDIHFDDEERLEKTFKDLDLDGNGKIDIHDLSVALKGAGLHQQYAKKFLESSDASKSGDISLKEFIHYVKEHEKNLKLVFSTFDKNKDGKLDADELVKAFKELGIEIERNEGVKLVQRMDTDGSLNVSYTEWRDFLLYAPSSDLREIIKYWRHSSALMRSISPEKYIERVKELREAISAQLAIEDEELIHGIPSPVNVLESYVRCDEIQTCAVNGRYGLRRPSSSSPGPGYAENNLPTTT